MQLRRRETELESITRRAKSAPVQSPAPMEEEELWTSELMPPRPEPLSERSPE